MERLKYISDIVKYILEIDTSARSNDNLLYYRVCEYLNKEALHKSFGFVLLTMQSHKIPPFESVRRARQKIQATHPELSATAKIEALRAKEQEVYRSYALGKESDVIGI